MGVNTSNNSKLQINCTGTFINFNKEKMMDI